MEEKRIEDCGIVSIAMAKGLRPDTANALHVESLEG